MKILHIGNEKNMRRYFVPAIPTENLTITSIPIGQPDDAYSTACPDAEVIIVDAITEISDHLISNLPKLKLIHSEGVSYNKIDLESAKKHQVSVCNCAGMNAFAVAEQTILLMLGMLRNVVENDHAVRTGNQMKAKQSYMTNGNLFELADCKVGLVGFGAIAQETAKLLRAFHAETYYYKRTPMDKEQETKYQVSYMPLDELLATCDIISVHVPVTGETKEMCDQAFFEKMKQGSYFVNTSRGELVDDTALIEALKTGKLAMAALDTMYSEPVETDYILINQPKEIADKILFSPHIAGITASSFKRGYEMISKNVTHLYQNETLDNKIV